MYIKRYLHQRIILLLQPLHLLSKENFFFYIGMPCDYEYCFLVLGNSLKRSCPLHWSFLGCFLTLLLSFMGISWRSIRNSNWNL